MILTVHRSTGMMNTLAYRLYLKFYAGKFIHYNVCGHILDLLFVNDECKVDLVNEMNRALSHLCAHIG